MRAMRWLLVIALAGCHQSDYLAYTWDDRRVLCSSSIDDLTQDAPWDLVDEQLVLAQQHDWVVMFHAHVPDATVSRAAIGRILDHAEGHGLDYVTFRELAPGPARGGLAFAFDDDAIDAWLSVRDLLAARGAHVTFFVTRYYNFTPEMTAGLAQLAADGHDIEPHSVDHLRATDYAAAHGLDAYLTDQVWPSFDILTAAGYPTATVYAYPFGLHDDAMDARILDRVPHVRTTPGSCPY
jgi:peptidoglycan/xylan/chitin deacetylase (PgdA/CDA1 family)